MAMYFEGIDLPVNVTCVLRKKIKILSRDMSGNFKIVRRCNDIEFFQTEGRKQLLPIEVTDAYLTKKKLQGKTLSWMIRVEYPWNSMPKYFWPNVEKLFVKNPVQAPLLKGEDLIAHIYK